MEISDMSQEDIERLDEIRNLPISVIVDAIDWWNHQAPDAMKRFVVVTTYFETILMTSEMADQALKEWNE